MDGIYRIHTDGYHPSKTKVALIELKIETLECSRPQLLFIEQLVLRSPELEVLRIVWSHVQGIWHGKFGDDVASAYVQDIVHRLQ